MSERRIKMIDFYSQIFKRKSSHLFRNTDKLLEEDISKLKTFIDTVIPLDSSIMTKIKIVPEAETICKRGVEYCV